MANQWFYVYNGQQTGPVALEQLQQLLMAGSLPPNTSVWTEGMPQWVPADQVPGLLQAGVVPNYQGTYPPVQGSRPTSVTVLAILGIVFSSLTLLCGLCGVIAIAFVPQQQFQAQLAHLPKPWLIISAILNVAVAILLLSSSIASLQLATWARKAMLAYAVASLVMSFVGVIASFMFADPSQPPAMTAVIAIGSFVLGLVYPTCVLYFFTRPHVIAAFESGKMTI